MLEMLGQIAEMPASAMGLVEKGIQVRAEVAADGGGADSGLQGCEEERHFPSQRKAHYPDPFRIDSLHGF